ncbi:MAG: threonine synthase [Clostridiales bacterium]|nr:threonine synthase [Clostridiales bacterium]
MVFYSTRSEKLTADSARAVLTGLAPDGGLYTPLDFGSMQVDIGRLLTLEPAELFAEVTAKILPDFGENEIKRLVPEAYAGKFAADDITPLKKVGDTFVLELFRGPTSAFKDVALSVLPRLISLARKQLDVKEETVILTATSGDTGKAALEGFRDVPGTRIIVFYPEGGVSDIQHMQMATQQGNNVRVCAVKGNFDDAQTGVKLIYADDEKEHWAKNSGARLSSANSINIGRLAPQAAYYFKAYCDLVRTGEIKNGEKINFAVPTGNFGNILAGEFARRMGLPVGRLICASNANNVLTDFIFTGVYDKRRPFFRTASPSMDILVSSNLERYLLLAGGSFELVAELMGELREKGIYRAPQSLTDEMKRHFDAGWADDALARETIGRVWREHKYLLDPHTAVAWKVNEDVRARTGDNTKTVVLSTASPYKFGFDVLSAVSGGQASTGFEAMDRLNEFTGVPVPGNLAELRNMTPRFSDCVEKTQMLEYVKEALR